MRQNLDSPIIDSPQFTGDATSTTGTTAATGSTQSDATALTSGRFNNVTGADGTKGVKLPATPKGKLVTVKNSTNAILKVYPSSGDKINGLSADAAISMAANTIASFYGDTGGQWWTHPLLPS